MASAQTLFQQAVDRIARRDWPGAERLLRRLTDRKGPLIPQAGYNLALVLRQRGGGPEVADWLRRVLAEAPDYHNARFELGVELMNSDAYEEAAGQFASYLKACPNDVDARKNLAQLAARLGHWDQAEEQARSALSMADKDPDLRLTLANILRETGRQDEADALYSRLLTEQPQARAAVLKAMTTGSKGRLPLRLSDLLNSG